MKNFKRVLSLALAVLMVIGGLVVAPVDAKAADTYEAITSANDLTAGTKFVIVANYSAKNYVVTTTDSKGYVATEVSLDNLSSAIIFEIEASATTGRVNIKTPQGYLKAPTSNALSFDNSGKGSDWQLVDAGNGTVKFKDPATGKFLTFNSNEGNANRLVRCYSDKSSDSRYVVAFKVYKLAGTGEAGGTTPDPEPSEPTPTPQPTAGTIAEALAGAENSLWAVKGVVTHIESTAKGSNIYVQDATGAICLRVSGEVTDIALGDTIEASGSKTTYQGVPQLGSATYTKSTGLTLEAKTTTIGALTAADICVYVKLTGLTVTEIFDNNGQYTNPNITVTDGTKEIQIYKAVIDKVDGEWSVKVGDVIDVLAAASFYSKNGTEKFQLRNTNANEITVVEDDLEDDSTTDGSEDDSTTGSEDDSTTGSEDEKEELTAAEILTEAAKLEDGQYLGGSKDVKYTLTGVIVEYTFNEQYGDATLTIKVDGTETNFYCYQVKGDDVKNLKVGDSITLNGAIKNYKGTIEFERPNLVSINATGDFSSVGTVMILFVGVACLAVALVSKKKMA